MKASRASGRNKHPKVSKPRRAAPEDTIRAYYRVLTSAWGPQHWWPADTSFEVIVGAFLTQNTSWTNVQHALENLRAANLLSVEGIRRVPLADLERVIRSSGYFRQKAARLKSFVAFLDQKYAGSLHHLFAQPTNRLREELLALNGVGPETADSILLYAGNHPVFVVDAYTRRIVERHGMLPAKATYEEIRRLFEQSLASLAGAHEPPPAESARHLEATLNAASFRGTAHFPSPMSTHPRAALAQVYNEMHATFVGVGKHYCKKAIAECQGCPLKAFLPADKIVLKSSQSGRDGRAR